MAQNCGGWVMDSALPELLQATLGSESTGISVEHHMDGIIAFGTKLDFISILNPFKIKLHPNINLRSSNNFKGITELAMFPQILEISLGFAGKMELSLLLCPLTDIAPVFTNILNEVNSQINATFMTCSETTRTFRIESLSSGANRVILPTEWIVFSDTLFNKLVNSFGNQDTFSLRTKEPLIPVDGLLDGHEYFKFYFTSRRMGQDLKLTDELKMHNWKVIARQYPELNVDSPSLLSVAVHTAVDIAVPDGYFPMWDFKCLTRQLGPPSKTYSIFLLPGVGNLTYDFSAFENDSPIKFIQMYTRLGHQLHRNDSTCFKEPCVANKLACAMGLQLKRADATAECEKHIRQLTKLLTAFDSVDHIVRQVDLPTTARCEIVTEHRCQYVSETDGLSRPKRVSLMTILQLAHNSTDVYTSLKDLTEPKNLVLLPTTAVKKWLEQTILPCGKMLRSATKSVLNTVELKLSKSSPEDRPETNFNTKLFLSILVSEALITMFTRGTLTKKWPVYLSRTLGLSAVQHSSRGDLCPIKYVKFFENRIECPGLESTNISSYLPVWIGLGDLDFFGEFMTHFAEFKALTRSSKPNTKMEAVKALSKEFLSIVCAAALYDADVNTEESICLKQMKDVFSKINSNKIILSPAEFVKRISSQAFKPDVIPTLFSAVSTTLKSKLRLRKYDFKSSIISNLTEAMLVQGMPLYIKLNQHLVATVLPCSDYDHNDGRITELYSQVFVWITGRKIGLRGIPSSSFFEKTLSTFIQNHRKSKSMVQPYFNAINFCLDQNNKTLLKEFILPLILGESLIDLLCAVH